MGVEVKEYFICDRCGCKDFFPRQSFSISFKKVNFSDDMIYDKDTEECWECKNCGVCISEEDIKTGIEDIKRKYKDEDNIS